MRIDNTTPKGVGSNPTSAVVPLKYIQQFNGEQYEKHY